MVYEAVARLWVDTGIFLLVSVWGVENVRRAGLNCGQLGRGILEGHERAQPHSQPPSGIILVASGWTEGLL